LWAFVEQFELYRRLVALREDLAVLRQVAEDDRRHGREYEEAERDPARASTVFEPARLAYERSLRSLAGMARAHGVRAAFCTYTTLLCLNMTEEQKRKSVQVLRLVPGYTLRGVLAGIDAFNETMREQARAQDVLLVDAAKDFPKDLEHFVEHVHHTDKGAALLASRVARVLLEAGWLDARGPVRSH
ncbi:MAG: hypothetical protein HY303_15285, partial [Candidatus Wallbacteria bacterium]|nr:hypothetical protein [Candidatus Wallbacteria bacterium]